MGCINNKYTKYTTEDGHYIYVKYHRHRSKPYFVAVVIINSTVFKKDFANRQDAKEWLQKCKDYDIDHFLFFKRVY